MRNFTSVSIYIEDKAKIEDCRKAYLKEHPQCTGMKLSDAFILHRMIRFFLR